MTKILFNKNTWLIAISAISCCFSVFIFFSFVYKTNSVSTTDKREYYSLEQLNVAINKERISRDLQPLKLNTSLSTAAKNKANDMVKHNYFSHISPTDGKKWSDFIKEQKYDYSEAGENLANGYEDPNEMVKAWMNSPSHRENILNKDVEETGFGFEYGKLGGVPTIFVVQVFGKLDA
jgi:uncharacterized protein YkwD